MNFLFNVNHHQKKAAFFLDYLEFFDDLHSESVKYSMMSINESSKRLRPMESHVYDIQIRVLIYKEDGEFVARALELDLVGYGKTESEAVDELKKAVEAQISFAHQMNDTGLLLFESEKEYFIRWEDAHRKALSSQILGDKSVKMAAKAIVITFTKEEIRALKSHQFKRSPEPVCAEA